MLTRQHSKALNSATLEDQIERIATPAVQPSLSIREHVADDGRCCRANSPHGEQHAAPSLATSQSQTDVASDDDVITAAQPTAGAEAGPQQTGTRSGVLLPEGSGAPLMAGPGRGDNPTEAEILEYLNDSTEISFEDTQSYRKGWGTAPRTRSRLQNHLGLGSSVQRKKHPFITHRNNAPLNAPQGAAAVSDGFDNTMTGMHDIGVELDRIDKLIQLSNVNSDVCVASSSSLSPGHSHHHTSPFLGPSREQVIPALHEKQFKPPRVRELMHSNEETLVERQVQQNIEYLEKIELAATRLNQMREKHMKQIEQALGIGMNRTVTVEGANAKQPRQLASESTDESQLVCTLPPIVRPKEITAHRPSRKPHKKVIIKSDDVSDSEGDTYPLTQRDRPAVRRAPTPKRSSLKQPTREENVVIDTTEYDSADDFKELPKYKSIKSTHKGDQATSKKSKSNKGQPSSTSESESTPTKRRSNDCSRRKRGRSPANVGTEILSPSKRVPVYRRDGHYTIKPEKYDGTTSLEIFLLQFDNCVTHNCWAEDESLAQLKGALKGTAARVLMGAQGATLDYTQLRSELQKCFGAEGNTAQYRLMLKSRRRHPGEGLRALYQDVCNLLMYAYPGPQNDLREQLSIEAFIDTLDDADLEVRVKDRFPKTLTEAFQVALLLEANRSPAGKSTDKVEKYHGEAKVKPRARHDVEGRHVSMEDEYGSNTSERTRGQEAEVNEKLKNLESELKETRAEMRRTKEREADEVRFHRLESQLQAMELRNRLVERTLEKDQSSRRESGRAEGGILRSSSIESGSSRASSVSMERQPEKEQPRKKVTIADDNPHYNKPPESERFCPLCRSTGHHMASCPLAYCGNCNSMGHTRRVCKVRKPDAPPGPCPNCKQEGHWRRDCPRLSPRPEDPPTKPEQEKQSFNSIMVKLRSAGVNESTPRKGSQVYIDMECLGQRRPFLLDSGCDVSLIPASYVKGVPLSPTNKRAYAANASEIDLLGEVKIDLKLGSLVLPTTAIVSENVSEGLIGYDWLRDNNVYWGFGEGRVCIHGMLVPLSAGRREETGCNRVVVQSTVTIPARCEAFIPAKLVFNAECVASRLDGRDGNRVLVVEPRETEQGLCIAGALLPPRSHNIPTRVINTSTRSVRLEEGEPLSEVTVLRQADVLDQECEATTTSTPDEDWIATLVNGTHSSVTVKEKIRLGQILRRYSDCFSQSEFDLGRANGVRHRIDTGTNRPVKQPLRRHPFLHTEEIDRQVKGMLEQGVIEPSNSPWASNVVIVKKKDNSLRFCVDYRRLNDVTIKDSYPLPRISDCLDALGTGRYFSAFDLRSGYFQVEMEEADKGKTSFVTRSGFYQFKVMPFGVTNGPATFQRLMDLTMAGLNYQICLVYLDDIILMSKTVDEHLERLQLILDRLRTAGLKLKPSKCNLLQKTIHFLGHVISENGITTDPAKIQAVEEWPVPTNVTEVRSFIGLCSYYRRFVKDFAKIAEPLHHLTGKRARFEWTDACQQAFEDLKFRLVSSPILAMPQDEGQYRLDTDASNDAIGAVLSQIQDGQERVIAYASRLLSKTERNYCVTRRELLAVIYFVKQFRPYVLGRPFIIRTDHAALKWLRTMEDPVGQQARWLETLEEYTFEVEHRPGKRHANADALSRRPCRQCPLDDDSIVACKIEVKTHKEKDEKDSSLFFQPEELREAYAVDPQLATFHRLMEQNTDRIPWEEVIGLDKTTKELWTQWNRLAMMEGVLYREYETPDGLQRHWQLIPPASIRDELCRLCHVGLTGGHMGVRRTLHQVQRRAYWPGWKEDVRRYCARCPECSTYHRGGPKKQGALRPQLVGEPWERVAIDLTGPHPTSRSGHVYILTVIDLFTKWAEAIPLRNKEAVTVARALMDVVFSRFGVPLQLLSDNGKEFDNIVLKEICRLLEVDKIRTTTYQARTNGGVERLHRTMNSMLAKVVAENQRDWDQHLPHLMGAYRASRHESTGYSPNFLMFGRENLAPLDVILGVPPAEEQHAGSCDAFVDEKLKVMRKAYGLARENLGCRAERAKKGYDMRVKPTRYEVGQWVYYYCPRKYVRRSPKWQRMYTGPFLIVQKVGPVNVRLQASKRSAPFISHVDKLKHCLGPTPSSWLTTGTKSSEQPAVFIPKGPQSSLDVAKTDGAEEGDSPGPRWPASLLPDDVDDSGFVEPLMVEDEVEDFLQPVTQDLQQSEDEYQGDIANLQFSPSSQAEAPGADNADVQWTGEVCQGSTKISRPARSCRRPAYLNAYV